MRELSCDSPVGCSDFARVRNGPIRSVDTGPPRAAYRGQRARAPGSLAPKVCSVAPATRSGKGRRARLDAGGISQGPSLSHEAVTGAGLPRGSRASVRTCRSVASGDMEALGDAREISAHDSSLAIGNVGEKEPCRKMRTRESGSVRILGVRVFILEPMRGSLPGRVSWECEKSNAFP